MEEIWRECIGNYLASNLGQIKNSKTGRILKQNYRGNYLSVTICYNNKKLSYSVHRLICAAFHFNSNNKLTVNHKDGIKENNYEWNLEWATHSEQTISGYKLKLIPSGNKSHYSKLTINQVNEIIQKYSTGKYTQQQLGDEYGVCQSNISCIILNKNWQYF